MSLVIGGLEQPTAAQTGGVRRLRAWLIPKGGSGTVRGHRGFVSTTCPSSVLYQLVPDGAFARPPSSSCPPRRPYR